MKFRVASLTLRHLRIPFRFAFEHAAHRRDAADHLLVELRTDGGLAGYGEILPRPYVSGETLDSAREDVATFWWPLLARLAFEPDVAPFRALEPLWARADAERRTASYAGVDVAVFDLWARVRGVPLATLFGHRPEPLPLSAPIGFKMPAGLAARAAQAFGFRAFKVKIGDDAGLARVVAVARHVGGAKLVVDANGSLVVQTALALSAALRAAGAEPAVWEEPLAVGTLGGLQRLAAAGMTLMADESIVTTADAERLIVNDAVAQWNLRLAKNGGFSGLRALARLAAKHGIRVQLGALVGETSVTGAAAFAAAALIRAETGALPLRVESSFAPWLLKKDPFSGGPRLRGGAAVPSAPFVSPNGLDRWTVGTTEFR